MILPNSEEFHFKDCVISGDECYLIYPKTMGVKWMDDNARFRSCIIRKSDNFVISQLFNKFKNWSEDPEFQPWNPEWKIDARHKLDDSLLGISRYKNEFIIRTRQTVDARNLPNGHEIDFLIEKYPFVFNSGFWTLFQGDTHPTTLLFAWTTPANVICIREHDEPTLTLIGAVDNQSGRFWTQDDLDDFAANTLKIGRPKKYEYNSVSECIADVEGWRGAEGVVLYSPDGQTLKKIKSSEYLRLHSLISGMKSISNVLDVFIESPRFIESKDFHNYISTLLDYEIAERCKDDIAKITEAYGKFIHSIQIIERAMGYISKLDSRKKQAMAIQEHWDGWMVPCAFQLLDNKPLDDKLVKKSMEKLLNL